MLNGTGRVVARFRAWPGLVPALQSWLARQSAGNGTVEAERIDRTQAGKESRPDQVWSAEMADSTVVDDVPRISVRRQPEAFAKLPPVPVVELNSAAIAPLTEWLELRLGHSLLRRIGRDAPGVPGWSIAPVEALDLLALDPQSRTESALVDRLNSADDALIVTRTSLPGPLARVAEVFSLSDLELRLLGLVLAPELDGRYATVIGVLQDDLTRRRPGLTLLAELLAQNEVGTWDLRRAIHASNSVSSQGLFQPAGAEGLPVDAGVAPSRAIVSLLLASSIERAVTESEAVLRRPSPVEVPLSAEETELALQLERCISTSSAAIHLVGGGPSKGWFARLAASIGLSLVTGDLGQVEPGPQRVTAVSDWGVLSRLAGSGLMVLGSDTLDAVERSRVGARLADIARTARLVATDGEPSADWSWQGSALQMRAPTISTAQRAAWWRGAAAKAGLPLGADDIRRLAATVPIDPERIDRSLAAAVRHGPDPESLTVAVVQRAARELSSTPLPQGVRQIVPTYTWNDIVLSGPRKELLQAIPVHVLQAGRVLEEWGFASRIPYGQGVAALFSGPSGTGKTMAAQIIAGALGVELLQVDLSKTISKYIGETEKNLERIFEAAEASGAVLLFDEADAIFGKRTEIKDAHDRHANVEVAYLLQRMESFRGLAVLTTNFKQNIDNAFVRRLRFVVEFALPTAAERERIWRKAFPKDAPLARNVDVSQMANRLQLPGGSIQNIALHAAFIAAGDGGPISAAHLLAATRRELIKIGMLTAERGLDELAATS
ncbi:ATP-binding protein [Modestobacter marinus]|uniref:ATP-binding protein n=1 Tax=Modestobacter marinus TaxID=477641 RepID=UPI001C947988|nr:ATP-binding protein [Modestobacter marinus]